MAYVTLNGIPLKIKGIKEDPQLNTNIKAYAGGGGSYTGNNGDKGREIELTVHGDNKTIKTLQRLKKNREILMLISESQAEYNGQYRIKSAPLTESKKGIFEIVFNLQEHKSFNYTKMNYTTFSGLITKKPTLTSSKTKLG